MINQAEILIVSAFIMQMLSGSVNLSTFYNHDRETNGRGAFKRKSAAA
ncbi:Transposase IS3/IS911 family protein [Lacticaseibacillus paracasei subsp. paracasei CNCM I-4648]|jgi:hypothetical protein|nr:hypothetical protein LCAM36_0045 [Lacticaseibacillus paracasei]EPC95155.1 Transposase IS3/IS911 family protein [Lacticaseibacillus paracasei subsp. paracasei CNCM I-4648]MDK8379955.1 hypothetical protein [Aerococcus urinae]EKQ29284.1 hypothetical protein LCALPC37_1483 [Lacticaseibacillus paracasei]OUC73170.1 hypothetical protein BWK52_0683 [Lacticaseibacillus paracasei]